MTKKLIRTILTSWLLFSSLYLPAFADTPTPAQDAPAKPLIKKVAEVQFLEGKTCLEQSNIPCAKMALALIPSLSPYAKILEGALALQGNAFEQALLLLLPLQADENLNATAKTMLHRTLAQAFANAGVTQQAIQHFIITETLQRQNQTDNSASAIAANQAQIWQMLQGLNQADLIALRGNNTDSIFQGWIDLMLASRHANYKPHITDWRSLYPDHPAQNFAEKLSENSISVAQVPPTTVSAGVIAVMLSTQLEAASEKFQAFKLGLETAVNLANITQAIEVYYQDQIPQDETLSADYFIVPDFTQTVPMHADEAVASIPTLHINMPLQDEANSIVTFAQQHHMQYITVITTQHEASQPKLASIQQAWTQYMESTASDALHVITLDADVLAQPVKLLDLKSQIASKLHDMVILAMPAHDIVKIRPYLDISTPTITFSEIHDIAFENDTLKRLNALRFVDVPFLIAPLPELDHYRQAAKELKQTNLLRWFCMGADSLQLLSALNNKSDHAVFIQGLAGHYSLSASGAFTRTLSAARFSQIGVTTD